MLKNLIAAFTLSAALSLTANAATLIGVVTKVSDGDTITVLSRGQKHRVRLNGIDAPESQQRGGAQSRNYLASLIAAGDDKVTIDYEKKDRYGRILGKVWSRGLNLNLEQVAAGHAWFYRAYAYDLPISDRMEYFDAEEHARKAGLGLWDDPMPTPPWEYRKIMRAEKEDRR